jgi:sugar phosphate isomerase/epimerase
MDYALKRRRFLQAAAFGCAAFGGGAGRLSPFASSRTLRAAEKPTDGRSAAPRFTLGFSLYGMNSLPLATAIEACAKIGYRDIEPALMPGYTADPLQLSKVRRRELRKQIDGLGLSIPALMENISAVAPVEAQKANLEKIARAAELAHDLVDIAPPHPAALGDAGSSRTGPVLETVLGGKPSEWGQLRGRIQETLRLWAAAGEKHDITIAVKAHVANALHKPEDLDRLITDIGSPRLRAAYDFSHFERQGLELEPSLRAVAKHTVFIHVKDGKGDPAAFQFLLPGEGTIDYVAYFRLLDQLQYRGSVMVEVSGQIFKQPGYDPIAAAKKCYRHLQAAYEASAK